MKKFLMVLILATILATGTAFADHPGGFGIGLQGGYGGGWGYGSGGGGALTLKFPSIPIFWSVGASIWPDWFGVSVAGDYYLIDQDLGSKIFGWYLGLGGYVDLAMGNNFGLDVGARLPIGLSLQPIPLLELYLQVVPSIGVGILPEVGLGGGWGGNLGIRLWF